MNDRQFDRFLREKLEGIRPGFRPEHWEMLDRQLDDLQAGKPTTEDKTVDEQLFRKRHGLEVPYTPAHWALMNERLRKQDARRDGVLNVKLAELSLLLLAALIVFRLDLTLRTPTAQPAAQVQPLPSMAFESDPDSPETGSLEKLQPAREKLPLEVRPVEVPSSRNIQIAEDVRMTEESSAAGLLDSKTSSWLTFIRPLDILPMVPVRNAFLPPTARISSIAIKGLKAGNSEAAFPAIIQLAQPNRNGWRLGVFNSLDYNRIMTPPNPEEGIRGYDRFELGYGGGLSVALTLGRWEIESGAIYSSRNYSPLPVIYYQGSVRQGFIGKALQDIQLNLINVPLNFRYNLLDQSKWRLYAMAGASLQVAFTADYDLGTHYIPSPSFSGGAISSEPGKFRDKDFSGGWLEGGTFRENGFVTGNVGVGVERLFSTRLSLFLQPTYQQSIIYFNDEANLFLGKELPAGLGPDQDRFHTLSIFTGIRIRLER
ncbi:MAG: outer membrane beta-barrel protein [Saprospiraceae bacterium]|nr:outer membrane beta-barrel protein [Saprospiraceae bacterium]